MKRREFFLTAGAAVIVGRASALNAKPFEITRTAAQWRAMLTDTQFQVMRQEATERAFSNPLDKETRAGMYHCRGCDLPLYPSKTKFDSGTGWPSFYQELPNAIGTKEDNTFFTTRIEAHCRRCGGHLGHMFDDGPEPTGLRQCLNGASLVFKPA